MNTKPQSRVARDEHGARTTFEDIEIGQDLGVLEWEVTPEMIEKQCAIDEDYDEIYMLDSVFGGPVAPPQIQYRPPRWLLSRNFNIRGLFYRWEFENINPIRPNEPITLRGKVSNKWIAKGREFVEFEFTAEDAKGDTLFITRRVHVLDVAGQSAPREGAGIDSGVKKERI